MSGTLQQSGPLSELFVIQDRVAAALRKAAGLSSGSAAAARLEPSAPGPAFQLGRIYFQNHDDRTAIPWLLKIKKENPHYLEANFLLGLAYFHLPDWEQGKRVEAREAVLQALERDPANAAAQSLLRAFESGQGSLPRP